MTERDERENDGHTEPAESREFAGQAARRGARGPATASAAATDSRDDVWPQIRDAVRPRSALLVLATLCLGLGFVLSYVGALHHPAPRNLPFDVVAAPAEQSRLAVSLGALPGTPLSPRLIPDAGTARARVADRSSTGALVVDPAATTDTLYIASAAGPSISTAVTRVVEAAEARQQRTVTVRDLVPVAAQDNGGLSCFYLAIGWTVTGYLIAAILGVSAGARPATPTRAVVRLTALALSACAAAAVGAWLVQRELGALPGGFWPLALIGALVVFGAGTLTMALQIALGVLGIGVAVLIFVILGNPSAGGAYARALLPPFWRSIGAFFPPGAGTDAIRSTAYFGGANTAVPLFILAAYCAVGLLGTYGLATLLRRKPAAAR
ncbi:hypothetical protein KGA66_22075 [Actinocrinis puniceicyclus]|uniref:DUF3533 domain-containing protein n=1 Tax=Actinocrinis puniceicyclus TaxID=977794 RepID=A0A8J7WNR3_9ACTN|nr:ABC transporter permease [Actinocrinis puniceicyclus]MBS2965756.1 hypothetical protein [Actinocrinis puniceicyclus]